VSETSIPALLSHLGEHAKSIAVIGPGTGQKIYDLPQFTEAEVAQAIGKLRASQPTWASLEVHERAQVLLKLHDLIIEHSEQFIDLLAFETGKARIHGFEETAGAMNAARHFGKIAAKALRQHRVKSGAPTLTRNYVDYVPFGVVGVITPWNYPLALSALDVLPALVAGNTVVHKIDNQTALTALYLRKLAVEAGLPEEVWTIVVGDGAEVGNAITDSVDFVAFTGSTATGRLVAERAAKRLIGYSLELGGKNPMIVLPNANLKRAATLAIAAATGNAGQLCVATERVYVANSQIQEFLNELSAQVNNLAVGKSLLADKDLGTLTSKAQLERVQTMVNEAVSLGAKLVAGGQHNDIQGPYAYTPAVLSEIPAEAKLNRGEVFGPVLQVYGYETLEHAINAANDSEYGLNASVIGPVAEALVVAKQLQAGSVNINEGYRATFASMDSPMGGFKQSGSGRRNGNYGLLRFVESRAIGIADGLLKLPLRAKDYQSMKPLMFALSKILRRL
jgi:succinate-semialdehyde dehydrogenase/glutarate-semialdehyde dehydrogenase